MGIILQKNDEILLFIKIADIVMKKIVKENDWAEKETDNMAREGLRTLLFGKKVLTKEEYTKFITSYAKAKLLIVKS